MKPSEEQMNRAMAEALGWRLEFGPSEWHITKPSGATYISYANQEDADYHFSRVIPDFCQDWNTHPQIFEALERAGLCERYWMLLENVIVAHYPDALIRLHWYACTAPGPLIVKAALRAFDKWPREWEEEETTDHE